jgi:M6 family metalloprotease-like protein
MHARGVDVTAKTGQKVSGAVTSWVTPNGDRLVEHLAGPTPNGDLMVFYWMPGQDWKAVNVSTITGYKVIGRPSAYGHRRPGQSEEVLCARGTDGGVGVHWWTPARDWQVARLDEQTGITFSTDPETWSTPNGSATVEHLACADGNQHLTVCWFDHEARQRTDDLWNTFQPLQTHYHGHRRAVVILWDPHRPDHPAPSRNAVEKAFVSQSDSVRQYFREASLGRFTFDVVEFLPPKVPGQSGWYSASRPADHYWAAPDPSDADGDGFIHGHQEKWAEAVWASAKDFNYSAYDVNKNGVLDPHDLLVCMLIPQSNPKGFFRSASGQESPSWKPLRSDGVDAGVEIPRILEIYVGAPHKGLIFHELAHLFVGAGDMYHGWPPESEYVPFTAGSFSLMATGLPANLDPFHRLKYGWLRHRLALRSGRYSLRGAVSSGECLVLLDRGHSTTEYFLVENRWAQPHTCDADLPDQGLAVWHIIEDASTFNLTPTPSGTDPAYWQSTTNSWGRRGVRLIRPVIAQPTDNKQGLWDGADPATGYDLLSTDPTPQHSELRWASSSAAGLPSGFSIRNISPAGPVMTFDITVPWHNS